MTVVGGWGGGARGSLKTGCSSTFQTSVTVYWRHQLPVASFNATYTATDVRAKTPRCRLALRSLREGRTCLTSFLGFRVPPELSCVTLIPSQQWASFQPLFPAPRNPTPLISCTVPDQSCGRRGLWAEDHVAKRWMAQSTLLSPLIVKY